MLTHEIAAVLRDPATSYWLREAVQAANRRDPLDALRDAEMLVEMLQARFDTALASASRRSGFGQPS